MLSSVDLFGLISFTESLIMNMIGGKRHSCFTGTRKLNRNHCSMV